MPPGTSEEVKPKDLPTFENVLSNSHFGINNFRTYEPQKAVVFFNEKFVESCRWPISKLLNHKEASFYGIWLARVHKYRLFFSKCNFTIRYPNNDDGQRLEDYKKYWDYSLYCTQDRILREFLDNHSVDDPETYRLFIEGIDLKFRNEVTQLKFKDQESQLGDIELLIKRCTKEVQQSIELKKRNRDDLPTLEGVVSSTFWHDPRNIPETYKEQKQLEDAIDNEYISKKKAKLGV